MTDQSQHVEPPERATYCSQYCKSMGIACIGTGRKPEQSGLSFAGYLLIKYNQSLEEKIERQKGVLSQISNILNQRTKETGKTYRIQAISDHDSYNSEDEMLIIFYRKNKEGKLEREKYNISRENINELIPKILDKRLNPQESDFSRDILICTHAKRDRCCGRFGYPIYKEISAKNYSNTKIWRSSHIGGHRMAPTMLTLPEGEYWGYLNTEIVNDIIQDNKLSKPLIKKHFRGGFSMTPLSQIADREGLIKYGNQWRDYPIKNHHENLGSKTKVVMQRGDLVISAIVHNEIQNINIGETKCGNVKDATQFVVIENGDL